MMDEVICERPLPWPLCNGNCKGYCCCRILRVFRLDGAGRGRAGRGLRGGLCPVRARHSLHHISQEREGNHKAITTT